MYVRLLPIVSSRDWIRSRDHSFACSVSFKAVSLLLPRIIETDCDPGQRCKEGISSANIPLLHSTEAHSRLDFFDGFGQNTFAYSVSQEPENTNNRYSPILNSSFRNGGPIGLGSNCMAYNMRVKVRDVPFCVEICSASVP